MTDALSKLSKATQMLAEAKTLDEIRQVMDLAEAARTYAQAAKLGTEAANHAAEIKLRAQRKAGEILQQLERGKTGPKELHSSLEYNSEYRQVLTDEEIAPTTAHRWQQVASLPEEMFEAKIAETWNSGGELTTSGIIREAMKNAAANKPQPPELPTDKYRIIYADPPWKYETFGVSVSEFYGGSERHYPVMTIEELERLPIKTLAADNAVLFLWVTSPKLNQVWGIIQAWGFEYKTSFVWDKVKHNFGYYNSVRHELLLVCGRGSSTPDVAKLYDSVQSIERSETHSEKPEEFRRIIDELYPTGKRIELFARRSADGWDTWGNEND